jgi:hypothetical protein
MNAISTAAPVRANTAPTGSPTPAQTVPTALVRVTGALSLLAVLVQSAATLLPIWPWDVALPIMQAAEAALLLCTILLLGVAWRTEAVGNSRAWRTMLVLAGVVVAVAAVATATGIAGPNETIDRAADIGWYAATVSMLLVGVGIVAAGTWRAPLRYLPLVAHSWPVAVVPTMLMLGTESAWPVFFVYFAVTQAALAVTLLVRPDLTQPVALRGTGRR